MDITQEKVRELFELDEVVGMLFWKVQLSSRGLVGAVAGSLCKGESDDRWYIKIAGKSYLRSRLIFLFLYGYLPKMVDHVDRNSLNDRPYNLRDTNNSLNNRNSRGRSKLVFPKGVRPSKKKVPG